ncbi:hypothetical protein L1049_027491 [Liquidambar formosana]|uniref:Uncharacterized protein n=1 Tax=Liquidambar formosana TaxID=63359 RepID=A0AAP0RHI1_LIQFO
MNLFGNNRSRLKNENGAKRKSRRTSTNLPLLPEALPSSAQCVKRPLQPLLLLLFLLLFLKYFFSISQSLNLSVLLSLSPSSLIPISKFEMGFKLKPISSSLSPFFFFLFCFVLFCFVVGFNYWGFNKCLCLLISFREIGYEAFGEFHAKVKFVYIDAKFLFQILDQGTIGKGTISKKHLILDLWHESSLLGHLN